MKVSRSEVEIFEGCPYCGNPGSLEDGRACCGEVHFTTLVAVGDEVYSLDEVEIIEDECLKCESPDICRTGKHPESFRCHDCDHEWKAAA